MDLTIISLTPLLKPSINQAGCSRLQLNVFVLQQNLKNIEPDASLERSIMFFDLFMAGPETIVEKVKENEGKEMKDVGFGFEECKTLLELCYGEKLASQRRETVVQARRGLDEALLSLSEFMWSPS